MTNTDTVLSGTLEKYCHFPCFKHWQYRLFRLTSTLFLYQHEGSSASKSFTKDSIIEVLYKDTAIDPLEFQVVMERKTLRLRARSIEQRNSWVHCLRPLRRYSETHDFPRVNRHSVPLTQFLRGREQKTRLIGTILLKLTREKVISAWETLKSCNNDPLEYR